MAGIEINETEVAVSSQLSAPSERQQSLFTPEVLAQVREDHARWRAEAGKKPAWKKDFATVSGMDVNPMAMPDDVASVDLAPPGEFPYTRGIHPTGYRGRLWTMRQFAGFGTPKHTNERFHYLMSQGQTGLSTAFHLPTLYGYDSDHPFSAGEVGKCGVAVDTLADLATLFHGTPLHKLPLST